MTNIRKRSPLCRWLVLAVSAFALSACSGLLDVENESQILEQDLDQEAALDPVVNGVAGDWAAMYTGAINIIGLVSFELIHTGSFPSWRSVETGMMDRTSNGNGVYNNLARSIWVADDAARRIDESFAGGAGMDEPAQVRLWAGLAKVMMGARLKSTRSAPVGVMSSLVNIFSASATDCSRP